MKRLTTTQVIDKFKEVHGNMYDYSKVIYTAYKDYVDIICKKHGVFSQRVNGHMSGKGCRLCNGGSQLSTEEFIARANEVHNNLYDYSKTQYLSMKDTITVTCKIHGDFTILAEAHTNKARGCKKCSNRYRSSQEDFIENALKVHGEAYLYDNVQYTGSEKHVSITCPVHGDFEQTPYKHLSGQGCPACNYGGFASNKAGILYYLSINNGQAYKIGITNRTVNLRFTLRELEAITILKTWYYPNGKECHMREQEILKQFKQFKYYGPPLLDSGNTELFSKDVLALDTLVVGDE